MDSITKSFTLILIGIIAISYAGLLTIKSVNAQSMPSPPAPEFTIKVNVSSLEVTIKNQAITAYINRNISDPSLYYGFRFKDNNATIPDWNFAPIFFVGISSYGTYYKASTSDYTVVSFPMGNYPLTSIILGSGQVDVQVMTLIGKEVPTNYQNGTVYGFDGVTSVWSNTQTITIPTSSSSPSPTVQEFPALIIVPLLLSVLSVVAILRHRKPL